MSEEEMALLARRVVALEKINASLMRRVEREMDLHGTGSFALFHAAVGLEAKVRERTAAVEVALEELKVSNVDLKAAKESADQANRAKSAFLATMSHEIRTPMNGVLGMAELLLGTVLTAHQTKVVETIQSSADTLLSVINDILDFSKVEAERVELEQVDFDLRILIEDTIELLARGAHAKGLALACSFERSTDVLRRGDPHRVRQIVTNLVANAIKFTADGHVLVSVAETERGVRISVADTGIGVEDSVAARLFEPFMQADGSTTRRYGGTGLGLAIVKRLCRLMNGDVTVTSTPARGATFTFTIDLPRQTGTRLEDLTATPFRGQRALVILTSSVVRESLVETLGEAGMEVVVASELDADSEVAAALRNGQSFGVCYVGGELGERWEALCGRWPALRSVPAVTVLREASGRAWAAELIEPIRRWRLVTATTRALGGAGGTRDDAPAKLPSVVPAAVSSMRVLLAEDNAVNREVAHAMLERLGCAVEVAVDGKEVCEAVERSTFDLVFMDCQMPIMDGFDATREVRRREAEEGRSRLAIVALTANALAGDRETCLAAGMDDFVSKPFRLRDLKRALETFCRKDPPPETSSTPTTPAPAARDVAVDEALDRDALDAIRSIQRPGRPDLLGAVVDLFVKAAPGDLEALRAAVAAERLEEASRIAHKIKGGARTLGARQLAKELAVIESTATTAEPTSLRQRVDAAHEKLAAAIALMKALNVRDEQVRHA